LNLETTRSVDVIRESRPFLTHSQIQAGALDLLSEHLPRVAAKARQEVSPTIEKILASMQKLLTQRQEGPSAISAFAALKTICLTTSSGEESSLMNFIAPLLLSIKSEKATAQAIAVLPALALVLVSMSTYCC
jgi:hypothetical protein